MIEVSSLAVLFGVGDVDDLSMSLVTHFNVDRGLLGRSGPYCSRGHGNE